MILIGDVHGQHAQVLRACEVAREDEIIVQLGDFWADKHCPEFPRPVHFIDGNHEIDLDVLSRMEEITEIKSNLFYIPRGTVLETEEIRVGCFGGGSSLDKAFRTKGKDWFEEEIPTSQQVAKMCAAESVDVLLTHTPPISVIRAFWPPVNKSSWSLPDSWQDVAAMRVDVVWRHFGKPKLFCGHMHSSRVLDQVRILRENEIFFFDQK